MEIKTIKGFPSHNVPNQKKDKNWIASYIKAAWADYNMYYPNQLYNGREKYHETKLYMLGKQSITRYKKLVLPRKDANEDQSWININWDILPIIPKFRRIALAALNKASYDISIDAIDPVSKDDKNSFYADNAARIIIRDELKKQGVPEDVVPTPDVDADSLEELDMYMNYSYKHRLATEMEMALKLVMNVNNFEEIWNSILEDIHDYGIGAVRESFDSAGKIKIRRVNPMNSVMSYSTDPNFRDIQYFGEVLEMTFSELKDLAGSQFTEEEYAKIEEEYTNGPSTYISAKESNAVYDRNYDNFRVRVLDLEFYSVNSLILEERVNNKGNKVYGKTDRVKQGKTDKKYSKTDYKVVYQGKWIIGTDKFFDCKLQSNMKRVQSDLTNTTLSYHVVAPDIYQMQTYSLGEQMKSIADQIQLAWYKLQNTILRAKPKGILIEIGSLENVPLGKGGRAMKPVELIDLYNQTGNLVYRRIDDEGKQSNYSPITELENGLGQEASNYFAIIKNNIDLLRDILGFNEITDGSTPDPRMLNGVAKLASESTNNSLNFIKVASRRLLERLCYGLTLRIQDVASNGLLEGYIRALGSNSVQFFKVDPDVSVIECGLIISQKPDEFEKERLNMLIQEAMRAGQITIADSLMIQSIDNLKFAEVMLGYRIKKKAEEDQQRSLQMQSANAQVQQQSTMVAEEEKRKTLQLEYQLKAELIKLEATLQGVNLEKKLQYESSNVLNSNLTKESVAKREASSREYIHELKSQESKPQKEEKKIKE